MIPFFLSVVGSPIPKVGFVAPGEKYFVIDGSALRYATFSEKRKLQSEEEAPRHPTGKYRLEPVSLHTDMGGLQGFKALDANGRAAAGLRDLYGEQSGGGNEGFAVLGWGRGSDDIVIQCESGSPASGTHYQVRSLNLRTKKKNPRIELGCAGGNALVIGRKAVLEIDWYKGHGDHPELFWHRVGAAPKPLRSGGHAIHVFGIKLSVDRRWALVEDMGQGSKPGQLSDPARWGDDPGQWLLVDTNRGMVRPITSKSTDYGTPWSSAVRFL